MIPERLNYFLGALRSIPRKYYLWGGFGLVALVTLNVSRSILPRTIFIVSPGEKGLIINLGRLQEGVLSEGTYFIFPYTTSGKIISVRVQKTDIESTARTKDLQRLSTKFSLNWKIDPIKVRDVYEQIGTEEEVISKIIIPALDEIIKESIPSRKLEEILIEREQLKEEIKEKIKKRLASSGLLVTDLAFVNLTASEEFTKATEARQIAEQQAISARVVAEQAIREAELETLKAKKEAESIVIRAQAEAQAQKLLQQTLTPELLQKQQIEKWNGEFPTVMGTNNSLPLINISPPPRKRDNQ